MVAAGAAGASSQAISAWLRASALGAVTVSVSQASKRFDGSAAPGPNMRML
jgi:hypothetical protein